MNNSSRTIFGQFLMTMMTPQRTGGEVGPGLLRKLGIHLYLTSASILRTSALIWIRSLNFVNQPLQKQTPFLLAPATHSLILLWPQKHPTLEAARTVTSLCPHSCLPDRPLAVLPNALLPFTLSSSLPAFSVVVGDLVPPFSAPSLTVLLPYPPDKCPLWKSKVLG